MKEKGGKRRDEGVAALRGKEHFRRCSRHFNPHWVDFLPLAREKCYEFAFCRLHCENFSRMPPMIFPFFSPFPFLLSLFSLFFFFFFFSFLFTRSFPCRESASYTCSYITRSITHLLHFSSFHSSFLKKVDSLTRRIAIFEREGSAPFPFVSRIRKIDIKLVPRGEVSAPQVSL